ncbi:cytochrome c biogenesis CcdA family protein [Xanthobacter autotrophicus DSM 431]|uniref:cytochrome c biogenesis CcdA family protein n=1 Tax=Xanthobacter nonsaccharivorans TaxID=3119912 RepID=UPI00372CB6B8
MAIGSLGLAFLAGVLSILSPCVVPLLPLVLGAAAAEHRRAPLALAGGVALSFVAIGLFVATIGYAIGLEGDTFRLVAAVLMIGIGTVLAVPPLQVRLAAAGGPVSDLASRHLSGFGTRGVGGQFAVGLLLGAVWSPCVGPTLGAASVLAAQGRNLGEVAAVMALFGLGAGLPLALLGTLSRPTLMRWRTRMINGGAGAKALLGLVLVGVGLLIVTGWDKTIEAALVQASPAWLTSLTTRF